MYQTWTLSLFPLGLFCCIFLDKTSNNSLIFYLFQAWNQPHITTLDLIARGRLIFPTHQNRDAINKLILITSTYFLYTTSVSSLNIKNLNYIGSMLQ